MLLDRQGGHKRRPRELHRFVLEEKLDGLAQVGERLLNRLALCRGPRFRIESDIAPSSAGVRMAVTCMTKLLATS